MLTSPGTRETTGVSHVSERLHYELECLATGRIVEDRFDSTAGMVLTNPEAEQQAFLRTRYRDERLSVGSADEGLYRFRKWLPVRRTLAGSSAPLTYRSEGLARSLDMDRLYITFSGYWPERGVYMRTGTFKECEAYSVGGRLPESNSSTLVVASAGNTARAFARVFGENGIPLLLVVPERNLPALRHAGERPPHVRIVAVAGRADYYDAIALAGRISALPGFISEGGAKNVARRDGMGTTVLSATHELGELPEAYFQAVGSGTGAIAAWETSLRILEDGRFGNRPMRLVISQNKPFVPIHTSWQRRLPNMVPQSEGSARRRIRRLYADVLANRKPPYAVRGGIFDAMIDTRGHSYAVSRREAQAARRAFTEQEGIDLTAPAAVAIAALKRARREGLVGKHTLTMVNVTGGGIERFLREHETRVPHADAVVQPNRIDDSQLEDIVTGLFKK